MQINELSIKNYKCFFEKQEILLQPGFNLFIGKNNSGKTTLLDALDINPDLNIPHKSELSIPNYGEQPTKSSEYSITIQITIRELRRILGNSFIIPFYSDNTTASQQNEISKALTLDRNLIIVLTLGGATKKIKTHILGIGSSPEFNSSSSGGGIQFQFKENNSDPETTFLWSSSIVHDILVRLQSFKTSIYRFSPIRTPSATAPAQHTNHLLPSATNLAQCINKLHSENSTQHELLCTLISRVFPDIKWMQSPINVRNEFELQLLQTERSKQREDLAITLNNMGTGLGNVIAILYVMLTARFPQIIAIDEPNSFLHPKALRELLQILESHGKHHQYILTGHSPEILTAIEPSTITYFDINHSSSKVKQFTRNDFHELRSELSDLGIRMTDLHAKDRVLWVEGQTEEIVLPKLLREYCPEISAGTAVLRVTHTGTFESRKVHITEVANTYLRLTQTSLAPPMVAIVLDSEGRKPQDIKKIKLDNNGLLHFLPYKMIENYVLDADAITAVLKNHNVDAERSTIDRHLSMHDETKAKADGAKILKEIFIETSNSTYEFRKTTHTPELFDWLLENKRDSLKPIELFVKSICQPTL